jgi:transcriptional regulator with XRE-family HTH domain
MSEYARALGARLRAIRQQKGLSLQGVEERSTGRWKAVVIGSYERGDRAVTVARLNELAGFYDVPVAELLPDSGGAADSGVAAKTVIDLEALSRLPSEEVAPIVRYTRAIQRQRGDYNGRVLSIRQDDLRALAVVYDTTPGALADQLASWGALYHPADTA